MPPFVIQHRIPWSDVDLAKILYFPKYFSYFEMAELEWFRSVGLGYEELLETTDLWLPRVSAQANFRAPARLSELLSIEMSLKRLGRGSYTFGYDAFRLPERAHLADGAITVATVSRDAFQPVPIPDRLLRLLETIATSGTVRSRTGSEGSG